jgi:hypothetical protein
MPPPLEVAEVLPSVFDAIGCLAIAAVGSFVYELAELLIMPLETRDILRGLKQELKQIQKSRGVLAPSVITSNPATYDHLKTGQRAEPRT